MNTERVEFAVRGIDHVEGGWPKDVDATEAEQTIRFRKKAEKEEGYLHALQRMAKVRSGGGGLDCVWCFVLVVFV